MSLFSSLSPNRVGSFTPAQGGDHFVPHPSVAPDSILFSCQLVSSSINLSINFTISGGTAVRGAEVDFLFKSSN